MQRPLYIFDLDGTLALIDHRRHIIEGQDRSDDKWRRFYAACDRDTPNQAVISVMEALRRFADVWVFTGRSEEVRDKTTAWLTSHTTFTPRELDLALMMRREGDHTPDDVLKRRWLDEMLLDDRQRLVAVFEDRGRVVQMWRAAGVPCFQVAEGGF